MGHKEMPGMKVVRYGKYPHPPIELKIVGNAAEGLSGKVVLQHASKNKTLALQGLICSV